MNLGNLYANLGETAVAERYYRLALKIDDLFYPAKMNLAVLLNAQGRNPEAATLLNQVLEVYPDNADAAYSLGLLLVEMAQPEEGLRWLRRASDLAPTNPRVHYNLGLLLQQLGRLDEAAVELASAASMEPTSLEYMYALADHHLKRGQLDAALSLAEQMIATHPDESIGRELKDFIEDSRGQRR
jgi:tetratricopeptide (TPR) repeat protein